jgi:hypothetical protein
MEMCAEFGGSSVLIWLNVNQKRNNDHMSLDPGEERQLIYRFVRRGWELTYQ